MIRVHRGVFLFCLFSFLIIDGHAQALTVSTIAGNGIAGFTGEGVGTQVSLSNPTSVAVDGFGNVYVADSFNNRIRKITPAGVISTVVGTGVAGFSGDGGPATQGQLNNPVAVASDSAGNLYIADQNNNRIRRVLGGVITTMAGDGTTEFNGDNLPGLTVAIGPPVAVAVDSAGNAYFSCQSQQRIRKVFQSNGFVTTVAGTGTPGFNGDGIGANAALINLPSHLVFDSTGNLYFADTNNFRIRKIDRKSTRLNSSH